MFMKEVLDAKSHNLFETLKVSGDENQIDWSILRGICTDGCPSMAAAKISEYASANGAGRVTVDNCFLHRHALVAKHSSSRFSEILGKVHRLVNYIKSSSLRERDLNDYVTKMKKKTTTSSIFVP